MKKEDKFKEDVLIISDKLRNNEIDVKEFNYLIFELFDIRGMFPSDEEISKRAEYSTDFLQRNGYDMSGESQYYCAGADMIKRYFISKKDIITGDYKF